MSSCCRCNQFQPDNCRTQITSNDLAELLYIQGLDENLCTKFAAVADQFQFRDCAGNVIEANSQIVTCAEFAEQLCNTLQTLVDGGEVVLGVTEVVGADCQTYVIPETPLTAIDTSTIDFTTAGPFGHNLTAVVRVSAAPGNIITINPDGLFAPTACAQLQEGASSGSLTLGVTEILGQDCTFYTVPETPISVTDTLTVDLTAGGPFNHNLSADVNISDVVGNQLVVQIDGLYVPAFDLCTALNARPAGGAAIPGVTQLIGADCLRYSIPVPEAAGLTCDDIGDLPLGGEAIPGVTLLLGSDCQLHTIPASGIADVNVLGQDTATVDMTVVEAPANTFTVSAQVVVSPNEDNCLSALPNGLHVPCVNIDEIDTSCIDLEVIQLPGTQDFTIQADIVISTDPNNSIECRATGLYASQAAINVVDTACIDLQLIGGTISANPIISPTPGNGLVCLGNGLYSSTIVLVEDTETVDMTVVGGDTISADVNISACAGNLITVEPDGLCVQSVPGITTLDTNCINLTLTGAQLSADPIISPTALGDICANTISCSATGLKGVPEHTTDGESVINGSPTFDNSVGPGNISGSSAVVVLDVQNLSACRDMVAMIALGFPQIDVGGDVLGPGQVSDQLITVTQMIDFNIPGVLVSGGFVQRNVSQVDKRGHTGPDEISPGDDRNATSECFTLVFPPGTVGTISMRIDFEVLTAIGLSGLFIGAPFLSWIGSTV